MNVEDKMNALKMFRIREWKFESDDSPVFDTSVYDYYKIYGEEVMHYSHEYLERTDIKELKRQDRKNKVRFTPSLMRRVITSLDVDNIIFRLQLKGWIR